MGNKNKNKRRFSFSRLFNNQTFVVILSLVVAVICWAAVGFSRNTEMEKTIRGVEVTLTDDATLAGYGLDIIDTEKYTVDVTVRGPRTVVGALTAESVIVVPDFSSVTAVGTYDLKLTFKKANPLDNFTIMSITPGEITLRFDTSVAHRFTIEYDINAVAAEGYIIDQITSSPGEIAIAGPEEEVAKISRVVAKYSFDKELSTTTKISCALVLYDERDNELSKDVLRLDSTEVVVTVPVYKLGILKLDIGFTNAPKGFDTSTLNYILSVDEIEVAGTENIINNLTTKIVGYVDLATFVIGEEYSFDIVLQTGLVNRGSETVTVTFPREGISQKKINVTDIRLENVPANYKVTIISQRVNDVAVIGRAEDIEKLLPGSVVAVVDFSEVNITKGRYVVPVKFKITSNNSTWVAGSYSVLIEVEAI